MSWRSGPRIRFSPRSQRVVEGAAWLLPIAALCLLSYGSLLRAFGLPPSLGPIQLGAPVVVGAVAWLIASRSIHPTRSTILAGILVVAVLALVPELLRRTTHDVVPSLRPALRLSLLAGCAVAAGVGALLGRRRRAPPRPLDLVVALVLLGMLYTDQVITRGVFLRDLNLYLGAGRDLLAGRTVYTVVPLAAAPSDPSLLPYVYPPPTIPAFALLAALPVGLVSVAWLVLQVAAAIVAGRAIGLSWTWSVAFLLWPPIFQGVYVGNVAIWMLALFAIAPYARIALGLLPVFKLQAAIASLWLVRIMDRRAIAGSVIIGIGLVVITMPLVGLGAWTAWLRALAAFQQTIVNVPSMGGPSLARFNGQLVAVLVGGAIALSALWLRPRPALASLGLATVALSPTLYVHGLTLAWAGLLRLRAPLFWLALCLTINGRFQAQLVLPLGIAAIAAFVPALRHDPAGASARWQPLGRADDIWPTEGWPGLRASLPPIRLRSVDGAQPPASAPTAVDAVDASMSRR